MSTTVFGIYLIIVIQSNFRVENCKEYQPIVKMAKLSINAVEDVEWLPTCYQVELIESISDSELETELDDDQASVILISSNYRQGSETSLSTISISEIEPFVSSYSKNTLVGSVSDNFDSISDISDSDRTDTASESEMDLLPSNATEIINNFHQFNVLPEVINNIIIYPQSGQNFTFLNQLEPSTIVWTHECNCNYPAKSENIVKFYFQNHICPKM